MVLALRAFACTALLVAAPFGDALAAASGAGEIATIRKHTDKPIYRMNLFVSSYYHLLNTGRAENAYP